MLILNLSLLIAILIGYSSPQLSDNDALQEFCSEFQDNDMPLPLKSVILAAAAGLTCNLSCKTSDQQFYFQGDCGAAGLSKSDKDANCNYGHPLIAALGEIYGCPTSSCYTNGNGDIIYTLLCPRTSLLPSITNI